MKDDVSKLTKLGDHKKYDRYSNPTQEILEVFPNRYPGREYAVSYVFHEFTSLCLHGDTLIDVAINEVKYPEGVPIKDLVGKTGFVFSFDSVRKEPVVKPFHSVRKTQENVPLVCVKFVLFKGASINRQLVEHQIMCTPEHPFLVRVGWGVYQWVFAKDLKENMQLVADQRVKDLIRGKSRYRLILEAKLGRSLCEEELAHHIDSNHYNNEPSNLEVMKSNSEHFSLHQTHRYAIDLDAQTLVAEYNSGENFTSLAKKYHVDPSTIYSRIGHLVEKRIQAESLKIVNKSYILDAKKKECKEFYEKGYTTYELAEYYKKHPVTISNWIVDAGGVLRTSLETKIFKEEEELPALNHKVLEVFACGTGDVYNMEVDDTNCFFANGVVVHNCPLTGQPDFAVITVEYIPEAFCIETKSLKLYYLAYRDEGMFMETITNKILDDLVSVCRPRYMHVQACFNPRGGTDIIINAKYPNNLTTIGE